MKLPGFFHRKSVRYSSAGFLASVAVYGVGLAFHPVYQEYQTSFAAKEFKQHGIYGTYKKHFFSFIDKLDEMKSLDHENQLLSEKLANLEKEIALEHSGEEEQEAKANTQEVAGRLHAEAGSDLARVVAAIDYSAPKNLLPNQLYTLGVGYFRKQEYEQAAVILSQLIELKEDTSYQKADSQLMCAIAWYKLNQFKLANEYLSQAKAKSEPSAAIYRTALMWEALTAQAQGKKFESQQMVTAIISRYPHSEEAAWVNQHIALERKPAAREKEVSQVLQRKVDSESTHHDEKHESVEAHSDSVHSNSAQPSAAHSGEHHED